MQTQIKNELHDMIDKCNNEKILVEAKQLLQSNKIDWWEELSDEDKDLLLQSETDFNTGKFTSHENVMQELKEWIKI